MAHSGLQNYCLLQMHVTHVYCIKCYTSVEFFSPPSQFPRPWQKSMKKLRFNTAPMRCNSIVSIPSRLKML